MDIEPLFKNNAESQSDLQHLKNFMYLVLVLNYL